MHQYENGFFQYFRFGRHLRASSLGPSAFVFLKMCVCEWIMDGWMDGWLRLRLGKIQDHIAPVNVLLIITIAINNKCELYFRIF